MGNSDGVSQGSLEGKRYIRELCKRGFNAHQLEYYNAGHTFKTALTRAPYIPSLDMHSLGMVGVCLGAYWLSSNNIIFNKFGRNVSKFVSKRHFLRAIRPQEYTRML